MKSDKKRIIAFIFARGGSKGLPKKNTRLLNGKPLIEYSIDVAKSISSISEVYVSTDSDEIIQIALDNKVKIIQRPKELASDTSPEWLSWQHAINYVREETGEFDIFLSLPSTSPLRNTHDVTSAIVKLKKTKSDACISVTPADRSPYFNMVKIEEDGSAKLAIEDTQVVNRRQDSPTVFDITTVVYAAKTNFISNNQSLFSGKVTTIEVPKERAIDIDDIYDLISAQSILNYEKED